MAEHISIDSSPLAPEVDFNLLRRQAILEVARLAEDSWTDYNASDPGITILEQLMFVLTDLGYRLSFDIKDLISSADRVKKQFFTANEVLHDRPVTENDYRRLLIDHPQVTNAKLEPILQTLTPLYWEKKTGSLSRTPSDTTELVVLKGLYRVLIETREEDAAKRAALRTELLALLNSQRNLGEYCAEVILLRPEVVKLRGKVELYEGVDVEETLVKLHGLINEYINPEIKFSSLKDLVSAGMATPDIYTGPLLQNGYITENTLEMVKVRTELRVSDILHIILDQPEVKFVHSLKLANYDVPGDKDWRDWVLRLSSGRTPRLELLGNIAEVYNLNPLDFHINKTNFLEFVKDERSVKLDGNRIKTIAERVENEKLVQLVSSEDSLIPNGNKRNLEYISVQNEFPEVYGIGEHGLAAKASQTRQAYAKQLQAYLLFFDQVIANYTKQLGSVADLFAVEEFSDATYFAGEFSFAGSEGILKETYLSSLKTFLETDAISIDRKNRFVDHLLARYGIQFPDYSLLRRPTIAASLPAKQYFLKHYPELARNRNLAMDYTKSIAAGVSDNPSGLKKRIAALLDIAINGLTKPLVAESNGVYTPYAHENFYLVEHILLATNGDLPNLYRRSNLSLNLTGEVPKQTVFLANQHGMADGQRIALFNTASKNGVYKIKKLDNDRFVLNFPLDLNDKPKWVKNFDYAGDFYTSEIVLDIDSNITTLTEPKHGLKEGEQIALFKTKSSDGIHPIKILDEDRFTLSFLLDSQDKPQWVRGIKYTSNTSGIYFENEINIGFPEDMVDRTVFFASQHGMADGDKIVLSKTKTVDGTYSIRKLDDDHFVILTPVDPVDQPLWLKESGQNLSPYSSKLNIILQNAFTGQTLFTEPDHGLADGEQIVLFNTKRFDGVYAIERLNKDQFRLNFALDITDDAKWIRGARYKDLYSSLITYVFPDWGERFANQDFRRTVEKIVRAETPAHIGIMVRWFASVSMAKFEKAYVQWLNAKAANDANLTTHANGLLEMLIK